MAYPKRTLRKLPETTRRLTRLYNKLASIKLQLNNLLPEIARLEHDSRALHARQHSGIDQPDCRWCSHLKEPVPFNPENGLWCEFGRPHVVCDDYKDERKGK